jgi:hypothetical protein
MFGRSETSAASSFWRRAETVKARVEGATLREARRRERVAVCRRAIVCLRACYRQCSGQLGRNDMMVIIVPAAVGQSESGGASVRAGHSLLLSQAQAEQLSVALSRGRCCYTTPALFHLLLIQTRKLPVLSRLLHKLLHFNLRFCAPCPFPPSLRILTFAST